MRIFCELRSIFPSPSYYMLNHRIRGSLFHYKKNCYFAIGFYFFGKSIKKHPDSLYENDNNNEVNVCALLYQGVQRHGCSKNRKTENSGLTK